MNSLWIKERFTWSIFGGFHGLGLINNCYYSSSDLKSTEEIVKVIMIYATILSPCEIIKALLDLRHCKYVYISLYNFQYN